MSQRNLSRVSLCFVVATIAVWSLVNGAHAQRPRSTIDRIFHPQKGFRESKRASRSIEHSRNYSRDLYRYLRDATVIKSESENLGKNIQSAQKELAEVAKQHDGDKDVQAALEAIHKHLAKAIEVHKQLHEECCKDAPDAGVAMHCCSEFTLELDKAAAEHTVLIRNLEQRAKASVSKTKKEYRTKYMLYDRVVQARARLRFIRQAKKLGFTLNEVKVLLSLTLNSSTTCAFVRNRAEAKFADIDAKVDSLKWLPGAACLFDRRLWSEFSSVPMKPGAAVLYRSLRERKKECHAEVQNPIHIAAGPVYRGRRAGPQFNLATDRRCSGQI